MVSAFKRIVFLLFLVLCISEFLSPSMAYAAQTRPNSTLTEPYINRTPQEYAKYRDEATTKNMVNPESVGSYYFSNFMFDVSCKIYAPELCTNDKMLQGKLKENNALGFTSKLIASTYAYPPASSAYYFADLGKHLGLPSAYAQGLGFGGLAPILPLWKAFRNVSYGFIIIMLLIIGLMVMFQVKIDPRTVISVQQSLPRIVVTLLLITFSYAIAGFLIDLMYLSILLSISVILSAFPAGKFNLAATQSLYLTGGSTAILNGTFGLIDMEKFFNGIKQLGVFAAFSTIPGLNAGGTIGAVAAALFAGGAMASYQGPLEDIFQNFAGGALTPLIYFIIGLGLLFMFIRILFLLINAYVQVIVGVIFGPIQILFDAFPIGGGHFSSWLKNLIANLAVFPTVVLMLLLGAAINSTITPTGAFAGFWTPPMIPGWTAGAIKFVIGLGIVSLIPSMAGGIKEVLKAKPALPIGIGAPVAPFVSGAQTALSTGSQFYYLGHVMDMAKGLVPGAKKEATHA